VSLRPISVGAPTIPRAWSPCGRLSSRSPNRLCLFSSWVTAAPRPDSFPSAPRFVVLKQPVVALASWLDWHRVWLIGEYEPEHHATGMAKPCVPTEKNCRLAKNSPPLPFLFAPPSLTIRRPRLTSSLLRSYGHRGGLRAGADRLAHGHQLSWSPLFLLVIGS